MVSWVAAPAVTPREKHKGQEILAVRRFPREILEHDAEAGIALCV